MPARRLYAHVDSLASLYRGGQESHWQIMSKCDFKILFLLIVKV